MAADILHCIISDGITFIRKSTSITMVQGLNLSRGHIFCTCPDWPWSPPSLLYNGYCVSFPGVKWPVCGNDQPPPSRAKSRAILLFPVRTFMARSRENFTFYTSVTKLIMMQFPHLTLHFSSINLVNFCLKTCYFPRIKDDVSQADNLTAQVIHTVLMHFLCLFSYTNVCKCHNLQRKELRSVTAQR